MAARSASGGDTGSTLHGDDAPSTKRSDGIRLRHVANTRRWAILLENLTCISEPMRYTTIIDIRDLPAVYRNQNARLLYLHLCLIAGYHDDDRDLSRISLRNLAADCGLTLSATRHAIRQLETSGLIRRADGMTRVRKWLSERPITERPKTAAAQRKAAAKETEERLKAEAEIARERERKQREELRQEGKTPFMVYYEEQLLKAAAGDAEAQAVVERRKQQYEAAKKEFNGEKS